MANLQGIRHFGDLDSAIAYTEFVRKGRGIQIFAHGERRGENYDEPLGWITLTPVIETRSSFWVPTGRVSVGPRRESTVRELRQREDNLFFPGTVDEYVVHVTAN